MISPFMSFMLNRCVEEGVYPDVFKMARVVPIHKVGDKHNVSNYRSIQRFVFLKQFLTN